MGFLDYEGLKLFKKTLTDNFYANQIASGTSVVANTFLAAPKITKDVGGKEFDVNGANVLLDLEANNPLIGVDGGTETSVTKKLSVTNKEIQSYSCLEIIFREGRYANIKEGKGRPLSYRWDNPKPGTSIFLHAAVTSTGDSENQLWLKTAKVSLSPSDATDTALATVQLNSTYELHTTQTKGSTDVVWEARSLGSGEAWSVGIQKIIAWA